MGARALEIYPFFWVNGLGHVLVKTSLEIRNEQLWANMGKLRGVVY